MDSNGELMVHMLMEQEANINGDEDEQLAILACLLLVQADEATNAEPKHGGSKFGRRKMKPRQRMNGHFLRVGEGLLHPIR